MKQVIFVFLVWLAASTIGGICGIGGGVVIKPLLDATGMMQVTTLSFLSGLTVLSMAVINVWKNRRSKDLDMRRSLPLGIGAAIGGVTGKYPFEMIKALVGADNLVGLVQSVLLGVLVLGTLLYVRMKHRIASRQLRSAPGAVCVGAVLGILSAFLGIGGGPMNLAVLYYFFSMGTKQAAINSILVILLSQLASLMMTLATASVPAFDPIMLAAMVLAGVSGGFVSVKIQKKLTARQIDMFFSGLLVVILGICIYNALKFIQ